MILFHKAYIAGLQEALKDQVDDLTELLPEYNWFGVGRDDGKEAGEFMAVFYRKDRFDVLEQSTFWLSETPESPTKGWDAMCYRVVTWGKFKDKITGKTFYLFNTHLIMSARSPEERAQDYCCNGSVRWLALIPLLSQEILTPVPKPNLTRLL